MFECDHNNQLENLVGGPHTVGDIFCDGNRFKSLEGFPTTVRYLAILSFDPDLPMLRTLVAQKKVRIRGHLSEAEELERILNDTRWLGQGKKRAMMCAAALIKAGLKGNAKW
jgi:hypothetical protein